MSATNRSDARDDHESDFFETPEEVTLAILPYLPRGPVLDPCAGKGAILSAVQKGWNLPSSKLAGIELQPKLARVALARGFSIQVGDMFKLAWPSNRRSLIIMNPPYTLAEQSVRAAIEHVAPANGTVAALLRLGFAGARGRVSMHNENKADLGVLSPRPSFCVVVRCRKIYAGEPCAWRVTIDPKEDRPKACASCGASGKDLSVTATDASEYAWWLYGPGRIGRWFPLPWSVAA